MKIFTINGQGASVQHGDIGDYKRTSTETYTPPDEENIDMCLNCKKPKCKGWCEDLKNAGSR